MDPVVRAMMRANYKRCVAAVAVFMSRVMCISVIHVLCSGNPGVDNPPLWIEECRRGMGAPMHSFVTDSDDVLWCAFVLLTVMEKHTTTDVLPSLEAAGKVANSVEKESVRRSIEEALKYVCSLFMLLLLMSP